MGEPAIRERSDYDVFADGIVVGRIMRAILAPVGSPWSEDNYDVFADGIVVGRIMRAILAPVGSPWFWTLAYGFHHDRRPTHGYAATREAAMAAFAKSWRRQ